MPESEKEKNPTTAAPESITLPYGKLTIMFAVMLIGLMLLVIGLDRGNSVVYYIGAFFLPAALLWGGLFLKAESLGIRITLLAVGGYLIAALLAGLFSLSSLLS